MLIYITTHKPIDTVTGRAVDVSVSASSPSLFDCADFGFFQTMAVLQQDLIAQSVSYRFLVADDGEIATCVDNAVTAFLSADPYTCVGADTTFGGLRACLSGNQLAGETTLSIPVTITTNVMVKIGARPAGVDGVYNRSADCHIDMHDIRDQVASQIADPADVRPGEIDPTRQYDITNIALRNG